MSQARGSLSRLVLDFEKSFDTDPDTKNGYIVPFNSFTVASDRALNTPETIQNGRAPKAPFDGNIDVAGDAVIPVDLANFWLWLKGLLGTPTTSQESSVNLDSASATDEDNGLVGLPITDHGLKSGIMVTITGTENYDGDYEIKEVTTDKIMIEETYTSESFSGSETVQPKVYDHVFSIADTLPSMLFEKRFKNPSAVMKYSKMTGQRLNNMSISMGGDGELTASFNIMGADEILQDSPYDTEGNLNELALQRLHNFQVTLNEGGSALTGTVTTVDLEITNNLDGDTYTIGNGGKRGDLVEGVMGISGTINALFNSDALTLLEHAINAQERSLTFSVLDSATNYYKLEIEMPEVRYGRATPPIDGPQGVRMSLPFQAYYGDDASIEGLKVTLKNNIQSY